MTESLRAYSVKEAAKLMGCSTKAVYSLLDAKQLAYFTLGMSGRCKRIRAEEIERWQRSGGTSPTSAMATSSEKEAPTGLSTVEARAIMAGLSASSSRLEARRTLEHKLMRSALAGLPSSGSSKPTQ